MRLGTERSSAMPPERGGSRPGPDVDPEAFNAFEAEGWELRADGYHSFFSAITTRTIEPLLDAAAVGRGSRVLDVATGPGYVAGAAVARGAEATGVDVAAEMVELAARLHPRARFVQGDAERLPFDDGSFDAAVANFAILHVGRPELAASELTRVVCAGGKVALTIWDAPHRSRLMGVFVDAVAAAGAAPPSTVPSGPDFFRFADEGELVGLLVDAGLADVEAETVEFRHRVAGVEELWDGMLGGTVRIRALIEAQSEQTKREIRTAFDRLIAEYDSRDGIELPVSVKLASGRRLA